jgi:hypothetical protein
VYCAVIPASTERIKKLKEVHQDELEYDSSRAKISQSEVWLGSSVPDVQS